MVDLRGRSGGTARFGGEFVVVGVVGVAELYPAQFVLDWWQRSRFVCGSEKILRQLPRILERRKVGTGFIFPSDEEKRSVVSGEFSE